MDASMIVLFVEVDDQKRKVKISFPNDSRRITLDETEARFLADALTRQIHEWSRC